MNYLGLDYGTKHLGIALATGPIVEPLSSVVTENAPAIISHLVEEHKISKLIIGLPEGPIRPEVENFVHALTHMGYSVVTADETLSTQDAVESLLHTSQTRRKTKEHSVAAALILQHWLDAHSGNSR